MVDTLVDSGGIDETMATSLKQKINNANKSATKENICSAVNQLEAFKNQVDARRAKKYQRQRLIYLLIMQIM